ALDFGFIWDDPQWYGRVINKSLGEILGPHPNYHFFRPGTMLMNHLFARADGTFPVVQMHALQIALHLLNISLMARLIQALGLLRKGALLAATAFFALYPLSHQAVVWTAPQHVWVTFLILTTANLYLIARRRRSKILLFSALFLYLFALTIQEGAVQFLPFVFLLEYHHRENWKRTWFSSPPWFFTLLALAYLTLWFRAPKAPELTTIAFEPRVGLYILQGVAYPLLGDVGGIAHPSPLLTLLLVLVALVWLVGSLLHQQRGMVLIWGLGWFGTQLFSTWAGLDYSYASLCSRNFYLGAFGVALLWSGSLFPRHGERKPLTRFRQGLGVLLVMLILIQSGLLIEQCQALYREGTTLMHDLIDLLEKHPEDDTLLFINYPDRYAPHHPPYPIGYWGVTLAPVNVPLQDFALLVREEAPATYSVVLPALDQPTRDVGPYEINMRGLALVEADLYEVANAHDATYIVRYASDGSMRLQYAGAVRSSWIDDEATPLVRFGETAELLDAQATLVDGAIHLRLHWRALGKAAPEYSVSAYVNPVDSQQGVQEDGAPALGLFPFWVWKPGDIIEEVRILQPSEGIFPPGDYQISINIYNWQTMVRLPATYPDGNPLPGNVLVFQQNVSSDR
ncbi:MAG: hypothetical protein ACP5GX_06050, partial [Anaerolineae bacterium]